MEENETRSFRLNEIKRKIKDAELEVVGDLRSGYRLVIWSTTRVREWIIITEN